jgi:hypothetical protein
VETDAADGNPLTTRIPTAAWKAQNAFHSSHKAPRRFHHRMHFFERQRSTLSKFGGRRAKGTMEFFENDENGKRDTTEMPGKGTQVPSPSPDPFPC